MDPRARSRPCRRLRPALEGLEGRRLPALDVQFALGIGVAGTNPDLRANAVAVDAAGDAYVTGSLLGSADFSAGQGTAVLSNSGGRDLFVAKYAPTGALLWAKTLPGSGSTAVAQGSALALDPSSNVLLTGSYTGTVRFGPGAASLTSTAQATDPFVAKLDASGNVLWARDIPETTGDVGAGRAITSDASGNVYLAGAIAETATFGTIRLTSGGQTDAFVAKLTPSGTFVWASASRGGSYPAATTGSGIAVDASGNVGVCGSFSATVDFAPGTSGFALTSAGNTDAFLWKLNPDGTSAWVRAYGGTDHDEADALAFDASGDFLATGTFSGTASFGGTPLTSGGANDIYVLKTGPTGQVLWVRAFQGTSASSVGRGIAITGSGTIVTSGDFSGTVDFDPGAGTYFLASAGSTDVFISCLDASGNFVAARSLGGTGADFGLGVAANGAGTVAIAGIYTGPVTFGTSNLAKLSPPSIFVGELSAGSLPPPAPGAPVLEAASDTGASASDGITAASSPVFDVNQAASGDLVDLLRDGVVVATRTGPGPIADPGPVPAGTHVYTAQQRIGSGAPGAASASTSVTFLTVPPPAPAAPTLLPADDSGVKGDGLTNVTRPRMTRIAAANATIQLLNASGTVLGSTTSAADGTYTVAPSAALADGSYAFSTRAIDLAGNVGPAGAALTLVIQTASPPATAAPTLLPADDSGAKGDGLTNVAAPRLTGSATANVTIQLLNAAGTILGTTTSAADGSYTVAPSAALSDGTYSLSTRIIDAAGNIGPAGAAATLTILTATPAAPAAPTLLAADDSGTKGDGLTNVAAPRLTGSTAAGVTVQLLNAAGLVLGSTTSAVDGSYTVTPASALADGSYLLAIRIIDRAGNVGLTGAGLALTIATATPPTPAAPTLLPADDSGTKSDNLTNVATPRLTGSALANATIQLLNALGVILGSTTSAADGTYTVAPASPLADGSYSLSIRSIDRAGNVGLAGPALILMILTVAPPAPAAPTLLPADDSGTVGDNLTNVAAPRLTGSATANLTIQLLNAAGAVIGTTTSAAGGSYTIAPASPLADGSYALSTRAIDRAGNVGPAGAALVLTILTAAPAAPAKPVLLAADDSGTLGDGVTNVSRPRLTGTAAANATIQLLDGLGTVLGTATSNAAGAYTVQPVTALADGIYSLSTRAIDRAGNVGQAGAALSLTILTATPSIPAAPTLVAADDSGVKGDNLTNVAIPRLAGSAAPNATIQLLNAAGAVLGSTTSGPDGSYSVTPASSLADGSYSLSVRVVDRAGNVGQAGAPIALKVDTIAPATPQAVTLFPADDTGTLGDGMTTVTRPRLVGFAEAGATVQILDASNNVIASAVAGPDGSYTATPTAPLVGGIYLLRVVATDSAGNISTPGPAFTLTILATLAPPPMPTLLGSERLNAVQTNLTTVRQPQLVGAVTPGLIVQLLTADGVVVATTRAAADGTYRLAFPAALPLGTTAWRIVVADGAGNRSIPSAPLLLTILSQA